MADNSEKPKTIPEALNLSERKIKAIYGTVNESMKELSAVDAFNNLRTMFTEPNELILAIYFYSMNAGFNKAKEKFEKAGGVTNEAPKNGIPPEAMPGIIQKCVKAGIQIATHKFSELIEEGKITINDPDWGATNICIGIGIMDQNGMNNISSDDIPPDLIDELNRSMNQAQSSGSTNTPAKKKSSDNNSDDDHPIYG
jgi:hypothetical protein